MASVRKKGRYEAHDLLDEFLLNQVVPSVKILKLRSFASCLGVSQTVYDRITAPNTYTQDEQIHKVSMTIFSCKYKFANQNGVLYFVRVC